LFDAVAFGVVILTVVNVHYYGSRVVYAAAQDDLPKLTHWVAMGGDVNSTFDAKDWKNITALKCAAGRPNHADVVRYLLESGANPNLADSHGQTPLISAAEQNQLENIKLLVAHGAALNGQDNRGFTALRAAAEYDRVDIARVLIDSGADVNIRDNEGLSPLGAATKYGYSDLKNLLQQKGAK